MWESQWGRLLSQPKQLKMWWMMRPPLSIKLHCCRHWCAIGRHVGVWEAFVHHGTKVIIPTWKVCPYLVLTYSASRPES